MLTRLGRPRAVVTGIATLYMGLTCSYATVGWLTMRALFGAGLIVTQLKPQSP